MTIIAIDLGKHPHLVAMSGTWKAPVLHEARRLGEWNPEEITATIKEMKALYGEIVVCCERTFTWRETKRDKRRYHRDTGRQQESQAGAIEMLCSMIGVRFERVAPVNEGEAFVAWDAVGRPEEGKGCKGEHIRDAIGVGLKGLILLETEPSR